MGYTLTANILLGFLCHCLQHLVKILTDGPPWKSSGSCKGAQPHRQCSARGVNADSQQLRSASSIVSLKWKLRGVVFFLSCWGGCLILKFRLEKELEWRSFSYTSEQQNRSKCLVYLQWYQVKANRLIGLHVHGNIPISVLRWIYSGRNAMDPVLFWMSNCNYTWRNCMGTTVSVFVCAYTYKDICVEIYIHKFNGGNKIGMTCCLL